MSRLVVAATVGVCLLATGASGASLRAATGPAEAADNHDNHDDHGDFHMALNPATQQLTDSITARLEGELSKRVADRADAIGALDQRLEQLTLKQKDDTFAYETAMTGNEEVDAAYEKTVQAAMDLAQAQLAPFAAGTEKSLADLKVAESEKNMFASSLKEAHARADEARASRNEVMARANAEFDKVHELAENTYKSVAGSVEGAWVRFQKTSKVGYEEAAAECERIYTSREAAFEKDEALVESLTPDLQHLTQLCAAAPARFLETEESSSAALARAARRATLGRGALAAKVKCAAARKRLQSATGALVFLQMPAPPTTTGNNDGDNSGASLADRLASWEHAVAQERDDATAAKKKCITGALDLQSTALEHVLKHKNEEMAQAKKNLKAEFDAAKKHLEETKKEAHDDVEDASKPLLGLDDEVQSSSAAWSEAKARHDGDVDRQKSQKAQSDAAVGEAKRKAKDARDAAFEFQKSVSELAYENEMKDTATQRKAHEKARKDVAAEMGKSLQEVQGLLAALGDHVELPDMTGGATGGEEGDLDMPAGGDATGAAFDSVAAVATVLDGGATGGYEENNAEEGKR
jgi:hypothetical protein